MNKINIPEDVYKQWDILILLLAAEEKKKGMTFDSELYAMAYYIENKGICKILLQWLNDMHSSYARKRSERDTALKCDDISHFWRARGNDQFKQELYPESYACYSKGVRYAHQDGAMYPLALANRSAALLRLGRFEECVSDANLAISKGYPRHQHFKLLLRQADCFVELRQHSKAITALSNAKGNARELNFKVANSAEFARHVKALEEKLAALGTVDEPDEPAAGPQLFLGANEQFVNASAALQLQVGEAAGRFVVAAQGCERGTALIVEAPYAIVALPQGEVCEQCCGLRPNPVPCACCSRALYCSEPCRVVASRTHHRWECAGSKSDLFNTIGLAHLALRVLLVSAETGFPAAQGVGSSATAEDLFRGYGGRDPVAIYSASEPAFLRMFNLVTNFAQMHSLDYIQYGLTATMLTLYLEEFTAFFANLPAKMPHAMAAPQLRLFAAALMLRSLGQLVSNGHATLGLSVEEEPGFAAGPTQAEREVRRATAIYPSAAMMNHSCDPNIINCFQGARLVVVSARALAAGEELLNCYGPHRARHPPAQRRAELAAQYHFRCRCAPCRDEAAPLRPFSALACQACKGAVPRAERGPLRCPHCRCELQAERVQAALDRADDLWASAQLSQSAPDQLEKAQASFRLRQRALHKHNSLLRQAADALARMFAHHGEYSRSIELIKYNIQSLEFQFGSFSVEVAHELRKLADVMAERLATSAHLSEYRDWCLETRKITKKAVQLMELNYGSWEPLVKKLQQQERRVASALAVTAAADDLQSIHHSLHYNLKI